MAQSRARGNEIGGLEEHQDLFRRFFASLSGCDFVGSSTRLHITLADRFPYNKWEVERIASESGWDFFGKFPWASELYSDFGYEHCRTKEAMGVVGSKKSKEVGAMYRGETLNRTSVTWEFRPCSFT